MKLTKSHLIATTVLFFVASVTAFAHNSSILGFVFGGIAGTCFDALRTWRN